MFDYFRMPIKFAVKNVRLQVYIYDHSGSANAKYQRWMLSATKQAVSIKPATTVGHFYETLTLQTFILLDHFVLSFQKKPMLPNLSFIHQFIWKIYLFVHVASDIHSFCFVSIKL